MDKKGNKVSFKLSFEQSPKEEISLVGFLFLCNGRFLQRQLVRNNLLEFTSADADAMDAGLSKSAAGKAQPALNSSDLRLFIAPASDKKILKVTSIEELERYKPYEPVLKKNAEK